MRLWNCDRLARYKVYTKSVEDTKFKLIKELDINKVVIPNVDVFSNFSVAVTVLNNAGYESDRTTAIYIGSKWQN